MVMTSKPNNIRYNEGNILCEHRKEAAGNIGAQVHHIADEKGSAGRVELFKHRQYLRWQRYCGC